MKTCTKCNISKPLDEFHNHSGRQDGKTEQCKSCASLYKKSPEVLARQRERRKTQESKAKRKAYWQTEDYKESQRKYRQSKKGKAGSSRYHQRRRRLYPERIKAKDAVNNAIRDNKMPPAKKMICQRCGEQAEHYHHESYLHEHRFDVIPFCSPCHKTIHNNHS